MTLLSMFIKYHDIQQCAIIQLSFVGTPSTSLVVAPLSNFACLITLLHQELNVSVYKKIIFDNYIIRMNMEITNLFCQIISV